MNYLPGVHRAPNIQTAPGIYEIENRATDPLGLIEKAIRERADWKNKIVLDLGAGTGFYIPLFHDAAHVYALEPHMPSRLKAMERCASLGLENASVMTGSAAQTFLQDRSIDIVHSRFAYFWPPDCEPGNFELDRIMRPGGTAFIIDSDYENGEFGRFLSLRPKPEPLTQAEKEAWWASYGFSCTKIESEWAFESRTDLESVIRLEFAPSIADQILSTHEGMRIGYTFCLYHRGY